MPDTGAGNTPASTSGQPTDEQTESVTIEQLRQGVKLNPGADKKTIHVTGASGKRSGSGK